MGSVLVIRNPAGQKFTDISSFALIGGFAFGECFLQLKSLSFEDRVIGGARGFGRYYVGRSRREIYDQYCRLSSAFRDEIEIDEEPPIIKSVRGVSIGISTGGPIDALSSAIQRPIRRFVERFSRSLQRRLMSLSEDAMNLAGDRFSTGMSGGFFNMFDGGALHGLNGHSTLDLDINRIRRMNFAVIQLGGGTLVGAGVNLLIIGDFPSLVSIVSLDRVFTPSVHEIVLRYLESILVQAYCYALIGDAAIGAILPGVDLNIIAS